MGNNLDLMNVTRDVANIESPTEEVRVEDLFAIAVFGHIEKVAVFPHNDVFSPIRRVKLIPVVNRVAPLWLEMRAYARHQTLLIHATILVEIHGIAGGKNVLVVQIGVFALNLEYIVHSLGVSKNREMPQILAAVAFTKNPFGKETPDVSEKKVDVAIPPPLVTVEQVGEHNAVGRLEITEFVGTFKRDVEIKMVGDFFPTSSKDMGMTWTLSVEAIRPSSVRMKKSIVLFALAVSSQAQKKEGRLPKYNTKTAILLCFINRVLPFYIRHF